MILFVK